MVSLATAQQPGIAPDGVAIVDVCADGRRGAHLDVAPGDVARLAHNAAAGKPQSPEDPKPD
jgi:hypothetical protein